MAEYRHYPELHQKDDKWDRGEKPSQMPKRRVYSLLWALSRDIKEQFPKFYLCCKSLGLANKTCKNLNTVFLRMKRFLALVETRRTLLPAKYDMSSLNFHFPFFKSSFEGIWWADYHTWITSAILLLHLTERHEVQTSCKFVHFLDMIWFFIPVPFPLKEWLIVLVIACCFPSWPRTHVEHWRAEPAATSGWMFSEFQSSQRSGRI